MTLPGEMNRLREAFFDKSNELFSLYDKDLNILDINKAALSAFRFKREDVIGKNLLDLFPEFRDSFRHKIHKKVIRTGRSVQIEDLTLDPSHGNLRLRVNIFKVGDGIGISSTDITDLKETIEELDQFMYRISHDLRGPLARILGLINMADYEEQDTETAHLFWDKVKGEVNSVNGILNRLSETMRIRKGQKVITRIDFEDIVGKVLKAVSGMEGYDEVRIGYEVATNREIYSDRFLLKTIVENLVQNAIKYRRKELGDSFIRIVAADDDGNGGVMLTVTDNGIGIPDRLQKKVFDMFFRATNQAKGAGLGLYTAKHSVKKLGGMIFLDSIENVGTTVTVFLPPEKVADETPVLQDVFKQH